MRKHFLVEGDVQGVGFRHFTWRMANRLGLTGWVRNLPDGKVEALADGEPARLSQFEAELRRGPGMASVTNLLGTEIPDQSERFNSFEIR